MVKVECDGCGAPYTVAEKRIPVAGLKMRCPKCGTSFVVRKSGKQQAADGAAAPQPGSDDRDLPMPAGAGRKAPADEVGRPGPAGPRRRQQGTKVGLPAPDDADFGPPSDGVALPIVAPTPTKKAPPAKPLPGPATPLAGAGAQSPGEDDLDWSLPAEESAGGFGEMDLPLPAAGSPRAPSYDEADLPVVADEAALPVVAGPGLPMPARPKPPGAAPRPGGRPPASNRTVQSVGAVPPPPQKPPIFRRGGRQADADPQEAALPAVAEAAGLPAVAEQAALPAVAEAGLPAVAGAAAAGVADLADDGGFGVLDLGLPGDEAALPDPVEAALPMAVEADLPSPLEAGLPMPVEAGLPSPVEAGLPSPVEAGLPSPVEAGLPSPVEAGLPSPVEAGLPAPLEAGLPSPVEAGLPAPHEAGLPAPMNAAGLPVVAGMDLPAPVAADLPAPPSADLSEFDEIEAVPLDEPARVAPPRRRPEGELPIGDGLAGGLLDEPAAADGAAPAPGAGLDLGPATSEAWEPPTDSQASAGAVGDEFTLTEAQREADDGGVIELAEGAVPEGEEAPLVQLAPKRSRRLRIALGVFFLLVIAGGSLQFVTPWGAFGHYAISDALNRTKYERDLISERAKAQVELETDTATTAQRAFEQAQHARADMDRFGPMASYTAYLAFMKGLRFGMDSKDKALGKQLLETFGSKDPNDMQTLARAAADAVDGQLARARQSIQGLSQRLPNDIDVAVLGAEIALSAKTPKPALELWTQAVGLKKSARTQYGLARAQLAAADPKAALASAREVLELSKDHAGARTLVASIVSDEAGGEEEALKLLGEVTDVKGPVRGAASSAELVQAYSILGQIYLERTRFSAAEKAFAEALKLAPQALVALIGNGELFYESGRYTEALARFEAALRVDADSIEAKIGTAKTWLSQERAKDAKELMQKTLDAGSKNPLVGYWLGKAEEALGDRDKAEAAYRRAIKVGGEMPSVVVAYVALAELLTARGKAEQAAEVLAAASEKLPESASLHRAKGEVALSAGRLDEAKAEFRHALKLDPENLAAKFKLGVACRRSRSFDDAVRHFDDVGTSDAEYPGLALERGLLFEETDQVERALEMYGEALKKAPNDLDLKLRVASTQVVSGHAKQAEPLLREVLRERPQSGEVNHFLGRALLVQHTRLTEALDKLRRATELDGNRAEYFLYLGWAANDAGQPNVADKALRRALELDKSLGDIYWQMGVLLQKRGATLDALRELQTALEKNPSRHEAYATMAQCYEGQGDYPKAEQSWRRAIEGDDAVALWHYRLGKILFERNRGAAVPELKKAVEISEAPADNKATPAWLHDAYQMLGDAVRNSDCKTAYHAYERVLQLAPTDYAYRPDARRAMESLEDCAKR